MKPDLTGKKLLILGAGPVETTLVSRAQELGIYVIVTDYNLDHRLSPAKDMADEYWDVSWSDLDTLEKLCRESHVDGVISGYSELRVENNIKLCQRLGLPCYCNEEQLAFTRDKIAFKETCRKYGVPVIREYATVEEVDRFPVIIKPTDRAGSIGISVATNQEELIKAYEYAMDCSICKKVIIEDYITGAVKFDVYYYVIDDEITCLTSNDIIMAKNNGTDKVVQSGWVMPSIYHETYLKNEAADASIHRLIKGLGIHNGYMFFSSFAMPNGDFLFFESGFRLCGGHMYNYLPSLGYANNMDIFIYYALTGSASCVKEDIVPGKPLKMADVNVYAKAGTIGEISGFDEVAKIPSCHFTLVQSYVGEECEDDKAILTKLGMAYFCSESADELADAVAKMHELVVIKDTEGNDMIYDRMDAEELRTHWAVK